ncbi:tRNA (N(6)-L-threonylcarbamoyladenosine(37)-C(2))-methylthiotransferase MtaB [Lichenibacterium minor]|uniref:tRNA (N(6)-L-threonylcarbamoyladenosine(37)-C(2))- methylthiotransferase MtaB n=1 Tax=Lichenibacterium minor TaxID=2316528 RepID=UPI001A91636D|nr:tRNA (N(6)-L-threonylcarbamoyladenosine(37)-C(2))-methylthiotransferase MtaB [Lichenibacterium minor]
MTGRAAQAGGVEVVTFGCRLNIVESEAMRAVATAAGHTDLVVVNSCAVTSEAVRQARQAVRRAARDRPGAAIVLTGCAAEIDAGLRALPEVTRVLPNAGKAEPAAWARPGHAFPALPPASFGPRAAGGHTRGFVEIQNGCDHRCTFCVIPFGRGASRSRSPERVVAEIRALVEGGAAEAVLTGVDVTSYAAPGGLRLGALLKRILREVPDLPRLRLSSIDCIEADRDLLDVLADEPRFMPHLHLSLQHGADLVLKRMKRRHSRADAVAFCAEARRLRPEIAFGADLIAGFPTETEGHAAESLALVADCGIAHLHVFPYSARPGTPAARMPAVPGDVVKARAAALRAAGEAALARHLDRHVGTRAVVLAERGGRGRTEDFSAVRLSAGVEPGSLVAVRIAGHDGRELRADG